MMETLYITQENCSVRAESEHLRLTRSGETLQTMPIAGVRTVVLYGNVNLSVPALDLLTSRGIDVLFLSKWGKLKARVLSAKSGNAVLKLAQHCAFLNQQTRLKIAKSIVSGKLHNQACVVRKYKYHDTNPEFDGSLKKIEGYAIFAGKAQTVDELMGYEGISAKCYWECFRQLLKKQAFTRREYRPSPDYVNALLNLGYAFLSNEITTCLMAHNFDIEIGMLHSVHYGRNSLALDIMEEFRAPFIDAWALAVLNKSQLKEEHFRIIDGDWRLTDDGFRKFCELYHLRVTDWRELFRRQSSKLKDALLKGHDYEPYRE